MSAYFDVVLDGSDTHPRRLTLKLSDTCGLSAWMFTQASIELLAFATAPIKHCRLEIVHQGLVLHVGVAQFHVSDLEAAQLITKFGPLGLTTYQEGFHSPAPPIVRAPVLGAASVTTPPGDAHGAAPASVAVEADAGALESQHARAVTEVIQMSEGY